MGGDGGVTVSTKASWRLACWDLLVAASKMLLTSSYARYWVFCCLREGWFCFADGLGASRSFSGEQPSAGQVSCELLMFVC